MAVHQQVLEVRTRGRGFSDLTGSVREVVEASGVRDGVCTVFVQHTSASLVISENADPDVLRDLGDWMSELAPESRHWAHDAEGADDMPAHARAAVTKTSETVPIIAGRLALGTWQAVYLWEHRARPHTRRVVVMVMGE
ncbi:MAG: YjbQ family protein [Myxococcales bacterium]|nr:YjbQ family protein [Myxococcales bacterium]